ncbi:MAG: B12-binding domain-containing radical SAM protein [Elusimicrobia bacterium]|nr:B12-binding domain-containing radical SAM protein [Candidatus Liberimonas magnetica]
MGEKERVLKLVYYFNMFDYPVSPRDISSLTGIKINTAQKLLEEMAGNREIERNSDYYFVPGKIWSVKRRLEKEKTYSILKNKIRTAAFILSLIPFVRGILLTGAASKGVLSFYDDFDFLIIAEHGHIWLCRTIIVLLRRLVSFNFRHPRFRMFCCNYYASDACPELPDKNEFTAMELTTSQPVYNVALCNKFYADNAWSKGYFISSHVTDKVAPVTFKSSFLKKPLEILMTFLGARYIEDRLKNMYYRHWLKKGYISGLNDFSNMVSDFYIKANPGNIQKYLLDKIANYKAGEHHSKLRTKAIMRQLAFYRPKTSDKMRILFTHAYYLAQTLGEKRIMKPYVPLGPLSVASSVRERGFVVNFFDTTFKKNINSFAGYLYWNPQPVIGIYILETTKKSAVKMIKIARASGSVVVAGGPEPSDDPQYYIDAGANAVVIGEGEETVVELLNAIQYGDKQVSEIPGLYLGRDIPFAERRPVRDLDLFPQPARDLVDMRPYFKTWQQHHSITSLHLTTSRGCPYKCSWCSKPVFGTSFRQHSPKYVVEEMLYLKKNYNPSQVWITDDTLGINRSWIKDFRDEVLKKEAAIPFECLSRVDVVNPEMLKQLKETGCFRVWYGAESGSQKILDKMNKSFTIEDIKKASCLTRSAGIEVGFFIMVAYPGETIADIELTRNLIKQVKPDLCGSAVAFPMKKTKFYDEVEHHLLPNWHYPRLENNNKLTFKAGYPGIFFNLSRRLIAKECTVFDKPGTALKDKLKYEIYKSAYGIMKYVLS